MSVEQLIADLREIPVDDLAMPHHWWEWRYDGRNCFCPLSWLAFNKAGLALETIVAAEGHEIRDEIIFEAVQAHYRVTYVEVMAIVLAYDGEDWTHDAALPEALVAVGHELREQVLLDRPAV